MINKLICYILCALLTIGPSLAQTPTEPFGNYVGGLPAASSIGASDQLYIRQFGVSKQVPGSALPSWFDSAFCSTVGYIVVRFTGAWTCSQSVAANPIWWGADPTGTNDSATAINAALAVSNYIQFPPGTYKVNSTISYSLPAGIASVRIEGTGQDLTKLFWPSGTTGISIGYAGQGSSAHIRDLTLATNGAVGGVFAVTLANSTSNSAPGGNAQSDITRVTIRGNDGYAPTATANFWAQGLNLNNISNLLVTDSSFFGPFGSGGYSTSGLGAAITGLTGSSTYAGVVIFANCNFSFLNIGIIYGSFVQGVFVENSNFTGNSFGIVSNPSETGVLSELSIVNSQFNNTISINLSTGISVVQIANSLFLVPSGGVIGITSSSSVSQATFIGNTIYGIGASNTSTGISGTWLKGTIVGNAIQHFESGTALNLGASSQGMNVIGNTFDDSATQITNSGTGNRIVGNIGYNPVGVSSATYSPATTVTYTAGASPETHYLTGGTVTAVKVPNNSGTTICTTTPCNVDLGPGETMSVTYSVAPTDTKSIH